MIHFDFGKLEEYFSHGRVRRSGAYHLMVEAADWEFERQGVTLATNESWRRRIDAELTMFAGRRVVGVHFGARLSEFRFENGLALRLSPIGPGWGDWDPLDNWVLFSRTGPVLAVTAKGRLQLCC
jgi:hypothetical protein